MSGVAGRSAVSHLFVDAVVTLCPPLGMSDRIGGRGSCRDCRSLLDTAARHYVMVRLSPLWFQSSCAVALEYLVGYFEAHKWFGAWSKLPPVKIR